MTNGCLMNSKIGLLEKSTLESQGIGSVLSMLRTLLPIWLTLVAITQDCTCVVAGNGYVKTHGQNSKCCGREQVKVRVGSLQHRLCLDMRLQVWRLNQYKQTVALGPIYSLCITIGDYSRWIQTLPLRTAIMTMIAGMIG